MNNGVASPQWDDVEVEVIRKLRLLRAAWEHTAAGDPALHKALVRDIYLPVIAQLGRFCVAVDERVEEQDE